LQFVKPVCLPNEPSDDPDKYEDHLVYLVGWGSTTVYHGKVSAVPLTVAIKVYSQRSDSFKDFL